MVWISYYRLRVIVMDPISRMMASAVVSVHTPSYTMVEDASSVNEGDTLGITVTTTNVANGTNLYWKITTNPGDFSVTQGQITVNNAQASFSVSPTADQLTEGQESFNVQLYTDSARTNSVASIVGLIINDTSTAPLNRYWNFKFHAYGSQMGIMRLYWVVGSTATLLLTRSGQYNSSAGTAWNSASVNVVNYAGQTGRFAFTFGAHTGYKADFALDEIEYQNSSGTTTDFSAYNTTQFALWKHTGSSTYSNAGDAAIATHGSGLWSSTNQQWCRIVGNTPSTGTGPSAAAAGQTNNYYYLYFEASGGPSGTAPFSSVRLDNAITLS